MLWDEPLARGDEIGAVRGHGLSASSQEELRFAYGSGTVGRLEAVRRGKGRR